MVWSTIDPEYGSFNWLRREVCVKLGYSTDSRLLPRTERAYVDSIIESGLMQFAYAASPAMPVASEVDSSENAQQSEVAKEDKRRAPHRWSFLARIYDIALVAGTNTYELPSDFSSFHGEPTTSVEGGRIAIVREAHLRQLVSSSPSSGFPKYCSTRKKSIGGSSEVKTEILLYPTPDAIGTISLEYSAVPESLDDEKQYPPGGKEHAETVLAYCIYVLSQREGKGLEESIRHLQDRLSSSIVIDRAASKPTADGVWVDDDGRFNYSYLSRAIGRHLGAGPNPATWTHQQQQMIAEVIRRTLRRIYNPPVLPGERYPHDWSFLRPTTSIMTVAGQGIYDLPIDFAMLYGTMTHATEGSTLYPAIKFVGENQIRQLLQRQESSARPDRAAIRVKTHEKGIGTRYELLLWPVPDQNYQIDYRYRVNPDSVNILPIDRNALEIHGGDRFGEMFLEASLLSADEMLNVKRSPHDERFMRALSSSVGADRMTNSPDSLGYNGDPSMHRQRDDSWHEYDQNVVTYNGVSY